MARLYLSTQLGPGPRDGLMTGIGRRFDWPIARVRLGLEIVVLAAGWALGGRVGVGTVFFAAVSAMRWLHSWLRSTGSTSAANTSKGLHDAARSNC